ncbi:MAG: creatininase family protein [Gemmatimonadota bacterium]
MRIADLNWMQLEEVLRREDRAVLPLGSTEQHATLSLATDSILAERVALEAAEPLGVPVFPVLPYGVTPYFTGYPGTVSLQVETYLRVVGDVLDNLRRMGCRRILLVNGHGGNAPAASFAVEWAARSHDVRVKVHNWWNAPRTLAHLQGIDALGSHASWAESFPWTRLAGVVAPEAPAPPIDRVRMSVMTPGEVRDYLGGGNMGGLHQRPDEDMLSLWRVGVQETREQLEGPWR